MTRSRDVVIYNRHSIALFYTQNRFKNEKYQMKMTKEDEVPKKRLATNAPHETQPTNGARYRLRSPLCPIQTNNVA